MRLLKTSLMLMTLLPALATTAPAQTASADRPETVFPSIPGWRTLGPAVRPRLTLGRGVAPAVPSTLSSYALKPAAVTERSVVELAGTFGLRVSETAPQHGKWEVDEPGTDPSQKRSLSVFAASGAFTYTYDNLVYPGSTTEPRLPARTDAHAMAVRFLRDNGLLPADALTGAGDVAFANAVLSTRDSRDGRILSQISTNLEVRFPRTLDGYAVTGPGSKLYVIFGDGGRIVGVTKAWREVEGAAESLPVVQPEEALRLLQDGAGVVNAEASCSQAEITRMEVVYWMESPRLEQRVALPVYHLAGRCLSSTGAPAGDFEAYAPAALEAPQVPSISE